MDVDRKRSDDLNTRSAAAVLAELFAVSVAALVLAFLILSLATPRSTDGSIDVLRVLSLAGALGSDLSSSLLDGLVVLVSVLAGIYILVLSGAYIYKDPDRVFGLRRRLGVLGEAFFAAMCIPMTFSLIWYIGNGSMLGRLTVIVPVFLVAFSLAMGLGVFVSNPLAKEKEIAENWIEWRDNRISSILERGGGVNEQKWGWLTSILGTAGVSSVVGSLALCTLVLRTNSWIALMVVAAPICIGTLPFCAVSAMWVVTRNVERDVFTRIISWIAVVLGYLFGVFVMVAVWHQFGSGAGVSAAFILLTTLGSTLLPPKRLGILSRFTVSGGGVAYSLFRLRKQSDKDRATINRISDSV